LSGTSSKAITEAAGTHHLFRKAADGPRVDDIQQELKLFPFRVDAKSGNLIRVQLGEKSFTARDFLVHLARIEKLGASVFVSPWIGRHHGAGLFQRCATAGDERRRRLAGLEVLRLVNEPTAASLAYVYTKSSAARLRSTISAEERSTFLFLKLISTSDGDIYQCFYEWRHALGATI